MLTASRWRSKQKNKRKNIYLNKFVQYFRSKRSPKTHLFKNALQSRDFLKTPAFRVFVYVWTDENGGFSNTMMSYIKKLHLTTSLYHSITHAQQGMLSYFHRFSNLVWTGENDSNTPRVDTFILFYFFGKRRKKSPFSNISGYM